MAHKSCWHIDLKHGFFSSSSGVQAYRVSGISPDFVHLMGPYTDSTRKLRMDEVADICFELEEIFAGTVVMWGIQSQEVGFDGVVLGETVKWLPNYSARTLWLEPFASRQSVAKEWLAIGQHEVRHKTGFLVSFEDPEFADGTVPTWKTNWSSIKNESKWAPPLRFTGTDSFAKAAWSALGQLTSL